MNDTLEYLQMFALFPFAMRRFLRRPLTLEQARTIVRQRLERREETFLEIVRRSVYGVPNSPYRHLLRWAGCEMGDLRALVQQRGLEGALARLRAEGVYVTFQEFKGRAPIVRGGQSLVVRPRDFDNRFARTHFTMQTGGSTGLGVNVHANLDHLAEIAPHLLLLLDAHGVLGVPGAVGVPMLPGGGWSFVLQRAYVGAPTWRWYSLIGWRGTRRWLQYDVATLYMLFWANLFGARLPLPSTLKPTEAERIARWMHQTIRRHGQVVYFGSASLALRTCLAAEQAGLDLSGATMRVGGEPVTATKVAAMRRVGARVFGGYGMVETGGVGIGCAAPASVDDVHLARDAFALITHPHRVEGVDEPLPAFNLTTLLPNAPKLMLNVQMDDYGVVEERPCGCPLDDYGYHTHLRDIRSYSKLLGESVTLIGNEMIRIIEEVLPARFGGSPLDYQLQEREDAQGFTRLYLVIHPRLEIPDERQVLEAVMDAMRESSPTADAARAIWRQTDTIRIIRAEPRVTARGKFLPLYIQRDP